VETELDVKWSRGSGDGVIILAREGGPVDADPVDGTEYPFDPIFGNGPEIGTGNYVVYVGAGTQTTIEGIFPDRSYHVAIYETVGTGTGPGGINYLQAGSERGSSGHNGSHAANCVECHFGVGTQHGNFSVPRDAAQQTACESCHNESGPASAKLNFSIHTGPKYTTSVDCGSCHEVHNQYDFNTTDAHSGGVTAPNIQWIRWDTTKYRPTALEPALFQGQTGFYAFDDANAPWNGICQTCHQNTDWHRNDNTLGNPSHDHNMPSDCRNCHDHGGGWLGTGGDCTGCHNQQREITANPGTFRRQITESSAGLGDGEFGTDFTSHHVNDGTGSQIATKWDCVVCHAEGNAVTGEADGTYHQKDGVQLKDVDTGVAYSDWSGLTPQQRRDFCLSCHDADGATIIITRTDPDPDATTNALDPFNDGVTNSHEPTGLDGKATPHLRGRCSVTATIPCVTAQECPGAETCQLSRVLNVAAQFNTSNTSHHAVLGAAYGSAAPFGSTVDNKITGVAGNLGWNAVLTCEDCHIGPPDPKYATTGAAPISGHGTPTARYMLRDQDGNEAATAEPSTTSICYRCHTPDDTDSVYPEHLGTTQHSQNFTLFGISCLQCHGGGTWGGIHGVDAPVVDDDGGGSYNPNVFTYGTGLDLISNWTNWDARGVTCSSLAAATALNSCTQHSSKDWDRNPAREPTNIRRTYRVP
jgi:hypothetical protein